MEQFLIISLSLSLSLARSLSRFLSLSQVLQTHDGPGDSASEYSLQWPGPRDTAHTFLDSGPGSTLGQGMGANPNGDATRTDFDCKGADRGGTINGNPAQVLGDQGIVGDFSWQSHGAAFLVPRHLLTEQRVFDFTWNPSTLDVLQG